MTAIVREPIADSEVITGHFSKDEAERIAGGDNQRPLATRQGAGNCHKQAPQLLPLALLCRLNVFAGFLSD